MAFWIHIQLMIPFSSDIRIGQCFIHSSIWLFFHGFDLHSPSSPIALVSCVIMLHSIDWAIDRSISLNLFPKPTPFAFHHIFHRSTYKFNTITCLYSLFRTASLWFSSAAISNSSPTFCFHDITQSSNPLLNFNRKWNLCNHSLAQIESIIMNFSSGKSWVSIVLHSSIYITITH